MAGTCDPSPADSVVGEFAAGSGKSGCTSARALAWIAAALLLSGCASLSRHRDENTVAARQMSLRGVHAMQRGQLDEAASLFLRASEMCPLDERIHSHYAETLWKLGSQEQAVAHMEEAVRLSGGNAELVVRLGEMYLARGDLRRAEAQADAAIHTNRQLASAWALRGHVLQQAERDEESLASYHRALSYEPHNPHVQLAVAQIYLRAARNGRALATLRALADAYPPDETPTDVLFLQGVALKGLRRFDAAADMFAAAARQERPSTELLYHLAEAQFLAGDAANARLTLQSALAQTPTPDPAEPMTAQLLSLQRKLASDFRL